MPVHIDDVPYSPQQVGKEPEVQDLEAHKAALSVRVSARCPTCRGRAEGSASQLEFSALPDGTNVAPHAEEFREIWRRDQDMEVELQFADKVTVRVECICGYDHAGESSEQGSGCGTYFYIDVDLR